MRLTGIYVPSVSASQNFPEFPARQWQEAQANLACYIMYTLSTLLGSIDSKQLQGMPAGNHRAAGSSGTGLSMIRNADS